MTDVSNPASPAPLMTDQAVPQSLLLDPLPSGYTDRFEDSGALWFCSEPTLFSAKPGSQETPSWWGRCGVKTAHPAKPNNGNSTLAVADKVHCLKFTERVNCGYVIPEALRAQGPFSIAIIYAPSGTNEPRTLFTINPWDKGNYAFLSERDNAIEFNDDQGSFALSHPLKTAGDGFRLVVLSYDGAQFSLVVEGLGAISQQSLQPKKDRQCDLFVGCRSHRDGILKTLGDFLLADVFVWPDMDILTSASKTSGPETGPEYDLLQSYFTEVITRAL